MKAAVLKVRVHPLVVPAGVKKIAVLELATDENNFIQNEALVV